MAFHPTALIDAQAQIDPSCDIGPHVVIGSDVRMGPGNTVGAHAVVRGRTKIGAGNRIYPHVVLGWDLDVPESGTELITLDIGDQNTFREFTTIHPCTAGGGYVRVEDHAHFGALSVCRDSCRIGRLAAVGGMTTVTKDVVPYCTVSGTRAEPDGVNIMGMQRAGIADEQISRMVQAYDIVFRSNMNRADAIARLEDELADYAEIDHFIQFLKSSSC
jgi:UDP-N-acetylglucosamine acyltransferase